MGWLKKLLWGAGVQCPDGFHDPDWDHARVDYAQTEVRCKNCGKWLRAPHGSVEA